MDRPFPPLEGVEHHFAQAGDIRMHYAEAGDPAGEPLVLLHGWPQNHHMWRRVIPLLEDRFRIIAPDLRGFGQTDAPDSSYAKQELADDVLALLDALELDGVRLVGHDWGGYAAFLAALTAPERFTALRAFSIVHPWAPAGLRPQDALALAYQPIMAMPFLGPALQQHTPAVKLAFREDFFSDEDREIYAAQFREGDRAEAASRLYRTFLTQESLRVARGRYADARLTVRTRLVNGGDDLVSSPALLEGWQRNADDMAVEVLDGVGHFVPEEVPEVVAERARALFG